MATTLKIDTGTFPSHNTQAARLLASLLVGKHIDPLAGWRQLGIYRLSDTVLQLRKAGWEVITGAKDVTNRFGDGCRVADYLMSPEAITAAGDAGVTFATEEFERMAERRAA